MEIVFFERAGESLVPTDVARSLWSADQMHGVAISGALARAAEQAVLAEGGRELVPARHTVDLFRPAAMAPCFFATTVVRSSNRLALVDTLLLQDDEVMARSSALFLKATEEPPGEVWKRTTPLPSPPDVPVAGPNDVRPPFFLSDGEWSQNFAAHQNAEHKTIWNTVPQVVSGEVSSGFSAAAAVADSTTLVTNWGTAGVNYINADVTLTLSRQPVGREIGLTALDHTSYDGVSVGSALVFDRAGALGTTIVTALSNAKRTVNFGEVFNRDRDGNGDQDPTSRV